MSFIEIPPTIKKLIESITKNENIENYDIDIHDPNKKGEGFMGELVFFSIVDKYSRKNLIDLAVKNATTNPEIRKKYPIRNLFLNEIHFYKRVWPELYDFQRNHNIEKPIVNLAKYYGSGMEDFHEYLVLENLKSRGFNMFDKKKFLSKDQYKFIFRQYGLLHGLSYALKKQQPAKFLELTKDLKPILDSEHESFEPNGRSICKDIYSLFTPEDGEVTKAYEKYRDTGWEIFIESSRYRGQYGTLLHGDCWNNNMMYKCDDNGNFSEMALIDFQVIRIGSPVHDLSYCLYSGATKAVLASQDEILRAYYESLTEILEKCGEKVDEIYPYSVLEEEWRTYSKFGMVFSFLIWKVRMRNEEEVVDLNDITDPNKFQKMLSLPKDEQFKKVIGDLVIHSYNINAL